MQVNKSDRAKRFMEVKAASLVKYDNEKSVERKEFFVQKPSNFDVY